MRCPLTLLFGSSQRMGRMGLRAFALAGVWLVVALVSLAHATPLTTVSAAWPAGGPAESLAFSPDAKFLASATTAGAVKIFSVTGNGLAAAGPTDAVGRSMATRVDGKLLALTTGALIKTYKVSGGALSLAFERPSGLGSSRAVAFSPDGAYLASLNRSVPGGDSLSVYAVSDDGTLTLRASVLIPGLSTAMAFGPNGVLAVSTDYPLDGWRTYHFDGDNVDFVERLEHSMGTPCAVAFNPAGTLLATSDCYYLYTSVSVHAINATGGNLTKVGGANIGQLYNPRVPYAAHALAFSPDGKFLATANGHDVGSDWFDTQDGRSPSGPVGTASMFSVSASGALTRVAEPTPIGAEPAAIQFSSDGRYVATANEADGSLSLLRVSVGGTLIPVAAPAAHNGAPPRTVGFHPSGRWLATADRLFSVSNGGGLTPVGDPGTSTSSAAAFSPDGKHLIRADTAADMLSVFAVDSGGAQTPIAPSVPTIDGARSIEFSPDGTLFAVVGADGVDLYRFSSAGVVAPLPVTLAGDAVAWRSDGVGALVGTTSNTVSLFKVSKDDVVTDGPWSFVTSTDGGSVRENNYDYIGPGPVAVAFSPDGSTLVTANRNGDSLSAFAVGAGGNTVTPMGNATATVDSPRVLKFGPGPAYQLVVAGLSQVAVLAVDGGTLRPLADRTSTTSPSTGLDIDAEGRFIALAGEDDVVTVLALQAPWLMASMTAHPPALTGASSGVFELALNYPGRLECRIDAAPFAPCKPSWTVQGLTDGTHAATVRAVDLAGVARQQALSWTWRVDLTGPAGLVLKQPADGASALAASGETFSWGPATDLSGIDHYELWIDGHSVRELSAGTCVSGCSVKLTEVLADGPHTWWVRALDEVGNGSSSASRSFVVDAAPPGAFEQLAPVDDARLGTRRPRFEWAGAVDAGAGVKGYDVVVDGQAIGTVDGTNTTFDVPSDLAEGDHQWQVVARDLHGQERRTAIRQLTIDTTPPVASLRVSPSRFVPPFQVVVDAGGSSDPAGSIVRYEFDLDADGRFETVSDGPRVERALTTVGAHRFGVRVVDGVGLTATADAVATGERQEVRGSSEASVTIDDGAQFTRSLKVSLSITAPPYSGAQTMIIANDGKPDTSMRQSIVPKVPGWSLERGDGLRDRRVVYVVFYNAAGLQVPNGRVQDDILYDPYPPVVRRAVLTFGRRTARLVVAAQDRGSGLGRFELRAGKRVLVRRSRMHRSQSLRFSGRPSRLTLVLCDRAGNVARARVRVMRG